MPLEFTEDTPPIPPADFISRVSCLFDADRSEAERTAFDVEGANHLRLLERALAGVGYEFTDFERLLDFGCGCGRFVRHLGPLSRQVEIHGVDIDGEMIEWLRDAVPFGHFTVGPHEPPLPYDDGHFDLVINHSVFTHLDERMQDLWLDELRRVTRPEGILLLTVQSLSVWNTTLHQLGDDADRYRRKLEDDGIVFVADDSFLGSTHPPYYHTTFHAPWYIFEHWTKYFDVAAYQPAGSITQDLVILRRRPEDAPAPAPIGHGERRVEAAGPPPPAAVSALSRASRLAKRRLLDRYGRSSDDVAEALASLSARVEERERTIQMLQAGLYEQGRRISVLGQELRRELQDRLADSDRDAASRYGAPTLDE